MLWWFLPSDVALYLWCWNEWTLLKWSLLWIYTCTSWQEDPREPMHCNEFTTKFHNTTLRYSTDSQHWLWKGGETKFYFWWWGATHWDLSHSSAYHIKVRFLAPKVGQIRAGLETRMKLVVEDPVMGKVSRFYLRTLSSNRLEMFKFSSFFNRCFYHLYFCSKSRYIIAI